MRDPTQLADDLEGVIHGAEPALTDDELDTIGRAIDYLRTRSGYLDAARTAGAHDEFIAFVAAYPDSVVAETLRTAAAMDALDEFRSFAGSFEASLWEHGAERAGNPDEENAARIRELFPRDRWPQWMREQEGQADA